jgi:hypothetical protein
MKEIILSCISTFLENYFLNGVIIAFSYFVILFPQQLVAFQALRHLSNSDSYRTVNDQMVGIPWMGHGAS